ncbi:MAG: ABC transporter ATP-binding protein [Sulfolobaceae archaeon]
MKILEVKNLKIYYYLKRGIIKAVDNVSLYLEKGEVVGLAGESGSGKSTFGLGIMRLILPPGKIVGGEIIYNGVDLLKLSENEFNSKYRWKKIAMVFQGSMNGFTPVYKIGAQIKEVLEVHGWKGDYEERVRELLKMVRLDPSIADKYPHELSGGQKQRAFIAMALALNPEILIADEPTTALDVITQAHIINLLKTLRKELEISMIFITHDLALMSELADRIYIMYAGRIVESSPSEIIYKNPKHPYTQLLLKSIPTLENDKIEGIPGHMPDLTSLPLGCKFFPRCPFVKDICKREEPKLKQLNNGEEVACWLY